MSKLESDEVASVVRGYHVYVAVWDAAVGQIWLLASEREATSMIPTLSLLWRIMTRLLIMTSPYPMKISRLKLSRIAHETAKSAKVFTRERFPF